MFTLRHIGPSWIIRIDAWRGHGATPQDAYQDLMYWKKVGRR
jgi:hypothetical protein